MTSSSSPSAPQGPQQPNGPAGTPTRTMADIARLFLDGARPTPVGGAPKRVGPQGRASAAAGAASLPAVEVKGGGEAGPKFIQQSPPPTAAIDIPRPAGGGSDRPAETPVSVASSSPLPAVMLALTGKDTSPLHAERLFSGVHAMAKEHRTSICVLTLQNGFFTLDIAGVESIEDLPAVHFAAGSPDMQVAHTLFTYRHAAKHWIIASPNPDRPEFARLAAAVGDWLLVTATDNDSVVAAYQQLKRAMALSVPEHAPKAVLLSNDYADAALIHSRLRRAAKEFLKNDLPLATVAANTHAPALRLASIAVGGKDDAVLLASIWAMVLDEICGTPMEEVEEAVGEELDVSSPLVDFDQVMAQATRAAEDIAEQAMGAQAASREMYDNLSNVLNDEERAALAAGLYDEPMAVAEAGGEKQGARSKKQEEVVVEKPVSSSNKQEARSEKAEVVTAVAEATPEPAVESKEEVTARGAIRAIELVAGEMGRTQQWEAVEKSIRDLVAESVLLDARPPMSWAKESCVAVDGAGGMHVWTLYKDGVSWFALREWANEHRGILALTRRDLAIEKERGVMVHVVMPLEGEGGEAAKPLLRTEAPGVFVYRLRMIQWQGRRGMIVVPIA